MVFVCLLLLSSLLCSTGLFLISKAPVVFKGESSQIRLAFCLIALFLCRTFFVQFKYGDEGINQPKLDGVNEWKLHKSWWRQPFSPTLIPQSCCGPFQTWLCWRNESQLNCRYSSYYALFVGPRLRESHEGRSCFFKFIVLFGSNCMLGLNSCCILLCLGY